MGFDEEHPLATIVESMLEMCIRDRFQEYDVEFVSSTEKFDTSTPMGRALSLIHI